MDWKIVKSLQRDRLSSIQCTTKFTYRDHNRIVFDRQWHLVWHHVKFDVLTLVKRYLSPQTEPFNGHCSQLTVVASLGQWTIKALQRSQYSLQARCPSNIIKSIEGIQHVLIEMPAPWLHDNLGGVLFQAECTFWHQTNNDIAETAKDNHNQSTGRFYRSNQNIYFYTVQSVDSITRWRMLPEMGKS